MKGNAVPEPADRPSIDTVIDEIMLESWYKEQIVERKMFDAKEGTIGTDATASSYLSVLFMLSSSQS